jgi:hypothetical protein
MDDRQWRQIESSWLATKALDRNATQDTASKMMVVWSEALRKSQEREMRAQDKDADGPQDRNHKARPRS